MMTTTTAITTTTDNSWLHADYVFQYNVYSQYGERELGYLNITVLFIQMCAIITVPFVTDDSVLLCLTRKQVPVIVTDNKTYILYSRNVIASYLRSQSSVRRLSSS